MNSVIYELRKFVAPEFVFGIGARLEAGSYARKIGATRVLVVSDPNVVAAGWTGDVIKSLQSEGLETVSYNNVTPNPKDFEVMDGVTLYREWLCNAIVAVGGGSPIDCAKGIAIVIANGGDILEYEGVDTIGHSIPPLICVPTTSGSAADVSQFAIINDVARKTKIAIISKKIVPDISLIDPKTTTTMDSFLTACTGLDTLTHAIEAFVSNANSPITDLHAEKAINLLYHNLANTLRHPNDLKMRQIIMFACLEAGLAFSNASLGAVHAMAHSLGGFLDLPHGQCNALLLESVIDFNYSAVPERFAHIASLMDLDTRGLTGNEVKITILEAIRRLRQSVEISDGLESLGVRIGDIVDLSEQALVDPCIVTNPRDAEKRDIEVIYGESL